MLKKKFFILNIPLENEVNEQQRSAACSNSVLCGILADKLRSSSIKTSRSAEQKKYRSQLTAGSVTHTGAAVGFKRQREHTHAQNLGDFFWSRTADRITALKAEMCAHSFRDKRGRGVGWWRRGGKKRERDGGI